jgi:hypothetical protein
MTQNDRYKIAFFMAAFGCVAVLLSISPLDHALNYVPVNSVIVSVEKGDCLLESRGGKSSPAHTRYMPCLEAQALSQTHKYSNWHLEQKMRFAYRYTSPIDGKSYINVRSDTCAPGGPCHIPPVGSVLKVQASKTVPEHSDLNAWFGTIFGSYPQTKGRNKL